jgi:hypothetical protein
LSGTPHDIELSPATTASALLWCRAVLARLNLAHPSAADILRATGARSTSHAYARCSAVRDAIARLDRPHGRPPARDAASERAEISRRVLDFVISHPGAVQRSAARSFYSREFRRFVVQLRAQFSHLSANGFARAACVPAERLRAWQLLQRHKDDSAPAASGPSLRTAAMARTGPAAVIARAYVTWDGPLSGFCAHVRHHLDIPWPRERIAALLENLGLRARRRRGRRVAAQADRAAFATFFPGAQWVADGTPMGVRLNGVTHQFNLELVVDPASGAIAGASIRAQEDSKAVTAAFRDARATTGAAPLALLLDQRRCNRTAEVAWGIGHAALMYAGRGRPQSKGHVEGAFGLFAQTGPELSIDATTPRELAREVLRLVVQCWARTLNHRPRKSRGGRSRVELYHRPTRPRETEAARAAIRELLAKQQRQHRRRRRPAATRGFVVPFIARAIAELGIADPGRHIAQALAEHPFEAVLAGVATYRGKRTAGTLPEDTDGRYLIGIVRRIAENDEGVHIAEALWHTRTAARAHLVRWLVAARSSVPAAATDAGGVAELIDHGLAAATAVERRLWMAAAAQAIRGRPNRARELYQRMARRIHSAGHLSYSEQLAAARALAAEILPMMD